MPLGAATTLRAINSASGDPALRAPASLTSPGTLAGFATGINICDRGVTSGCSPAPVAALRARDGQNAGPQARGLAGYPICGLAMA